MSKKYYAIKEAKNVKNKIVRSWDECKSIVHGCNAVYKSFKTEEEAMGYLATVNTEKIKGQAKKGIEQRKKQKATTKMVQARISKEMYKDLEERCNEINLKVDDVIKFALSNYLYSE